MSTLSPNAPAAERVMPHSAADLVLATPTRIRDSNGDYLDIQPARDGVPARFITVPVSRLRHAFRVHRVQDIRSRRYKVELEPVPLSGEPYGGADAQHPAPRYPMEMADHGCVDFELTLPKPDLLAEPPMNRAPHGIKPLLEEEPPEDLRFALDVEMANLAFAASSGKFPAFTGDSKRALDYIASGLGVDPHSETVDESSLGRITRPADIPEQAWKEVTNQLHLEIHYRRLCSEYFQAFREFNQNVFIANGDLVNTVGSLLELEDDMTRIIHLGVSGMFSAIAGGVGALGFPDAGVVSGALKVAFDFMLKDQGPEAGELRVAYASVRDELAKKFNLIITQTQRCKTETFADWGKLRQMGESLELNGGKNRWPADDSEMRAEAARLFEVSIWKNLLNVRWHHMTSSENPIFYKNYGEGNKQGMEAAHKNYWIEYHAGKGTPSGALKEEDGYLVNQHWLGYGNVQGLHHEPHDAMCNRLFGDKLKISRKEVFTDSTWNLKPETFYLIDPKNVQ